MVGMTVAINSAINSSMNSTANWLRARCERARMGAKTPDENGHFNANAPRQLSAIDIQIVNSFMKVTKLLEETLDFGLRNTWGRQGRFV
jgi:hypothetical protein